MEFASNEKANIRQALAHNSEDARIVVAMADIRVYDRFADLFEEARQRYPRIRFLSLNYFLSKWFQERAIPHDCLNASPEGEEHSQIMQRAESLSKTWFRENNNGHDFTEHQGLSLGFCLEWPSYNFFHTALKCAADIRSYLNQENPDTLYYLHSEPGEFRVVDFVHFDVFKTLLPFICQKSQVPFEKWTANIPASSMDQDNRWLAGFAPAPPMRIGEKEIRLPKFLYFALKALFLLAKNIPAKAGYHPRKPNVFFAGPTTVNYLGTPLLKEIIRSNRFNLFVWEGESRQKPIVNLTSPGKWAFKRTRKRKLQEIFRKQFLTDKENIQRTTRCEALPIGELFSHFFEDLYNNHFPDLVIHAERVRNQLMRIKAHAVISHTENTPFERATLEVGNALSVPTIYFQHGLYWLRKQTSLASYSFLWGKVIREFKISTGIDPQRIKVVGRSMPEPSDNSGPVPPLNLGSPGTLLLILNAAWHYRMDKLGFSDNEQILKLCLQMIKVFPAKKLIVKPRHDDLQTGIYQKAITAANVPNVEISSQPILQLLGNCDIFFHAESTSALEGMLLGKPGIQLRFPFRDGGSFKRSPFVEYGANVAVDHPNPETLIEAVNNLYRSAELREKLQEGSKRFLQDHANWGSGDAAQNFIDALTSLIVTPRNENGKLT
ncbi:MAG: hypothetical protein VYC17_05565 [Nitrospinota bacterium]|nr:hypothetical protein [Nitrospinota bacterium]